MHDLSLDMVTSSKMDEIHAWCFLILIDKDSWLLQLQIRRDGTKLTLAQSRKLSQLTADNAQWEDRQLLRSGAVRGTQVQNEFDEEEECKVILLVHGKISVGLNSQWHS